MRRHPLDLIQSDAEWNTYATAVDEKLELRLGLPGGEHWSVVQEKRELPIEPSLSLGHISKLPKSNNVTGSSATQRGLTSPVVSKTEAFRQHKQLGFLQSQAKGTDSFQKTSGNTEQQQQQQSLEGKSKNSTIVQINSHSRIMPAPVVGWPPIRSFRKNLVGASKVSIEFQNGNFKVLKKCKNERKSLFVKINMDGIPIGRKVDLLAYDSYENLSMAVDELFQDLMAENLVITGLLDGSAEYTLVYEDDEGDKMLAGDVPWEMFVSSAKRLRVLKSRDLSASSVNTLVSRWEQ
ncbi:auxin-responsive protein IAA18-like [Curcuma longa]|uniref:auxin-responsive protein IAA18-like n=1 Tax=Curcuma longa TaxID=136217 RepID=UPI003D9F2DF7